MFIFFCNVFYVWLSIRLIVVSCAAACVVLTVNGGMPHTVNAYYFNFDVVAHTHERLEWIFFRKTIHLFLLFRSIFFYFHYPLVVVYRWGVFRHLLKQTQFRSLLIIHSTREIPWHFDACRCGRIVQAHAFVSMYWWIWCIPPFAQIHFSFYLFFGWLGVCFVLCECV